MSSSGIFTIMTAVSKRHAVRQKWENDFQANHAIFAQDLAERITKQLLDAFEARVQNPYSADLTKINRVACRRSIAFHKENSRKEILELFQESKLPEPFHTWMTDESENQIRGIQNSEYFNVRANIVGKIAVNKIRELIDRYRTSNYLHDLEYEVKWESEYGYLGSVFANVWLNDRFYPSGTNPTESEIVVSECKKQNEIERKSYITFAVTVSTIAFIVAGLFQQGILTWGTSKKSTH